MKTTLIIVVIITLLCSYSLAKTINVPADVESIQGGIDMAVDGDTILVQPDTYYENINFNGKDIVVGSLTLTTGDTSYISQTVIDGDNSGSVVRFKSGEDSTTLFYGFTIMNGTGIEDPRDGFTGSIVGGGICCHKSSPRILFCKIKNNDGVTHGAGIFCSNSHALLENLIISQNTTQGQGAGIYSYYSTLVLKNINVFENNNLCNSDLRGEGGGIYTERCNLNMTNVRIFSNSAQNGGGLYGDFDNSIIMSNVKIFNNEAYLGGGLYLHGSLVKFDATNRSSIYLNSAYKGNDIYTVQLDIYDIPAPLDTFTVLQPTKYFVQGNVFNFDIHHAKKEKITGNIYVDDNGNNENSGSNSKEPLKSIALALELIEPDSLNISTIYVAEGCYEVFSNYETYPLIMKSYTTIQGESLSNVILKSCFKYGSYTWNSDAIHLDLVNKCSFKNLQIINTDIYSEGSTAINSHSSNYEMDNIYITGYPINQITNTPIGPEGITAINSHSSNYEMDSIYITGYTLNGITSEYSNLTLSNCMIKNNKGQLGGGIKSIYSDIEIINSKISNNKSESGGGIYASNSNVSLFGTSVNKNFSSNFGGGIYLSNSEIYFDQNNLNSIYLNEAIQGLDIYNNGNQIVYMNLDTFTVDKSTHYYSFPSYLYNCDILNPINTLITSDFFVSSSGNNSNSGLSSDSPLQSITLALSKIYTDSSNIHTIYISDGGYNLVTDNNSIPVYLNDYLNIQGQSVSETIINADGLGSALYIYNAKFSSISNLSITGGISQDGGGIYLFKSKLSLSNVLFAGNTSTGYYPGWFYRPGSGGGIYADQSEIYLNHVTFANNRTINWGGTGGALGLINSSAELVNSILWNNLPEEVSCDSSTIAVAYSDVRNGSDSIKVLGNSQIFWLNKNIDADPLFRDTTLFNYQLSTMSPCIDNAIHDTIIYYNSGNDSIVIPPISYIGFNPDIGAFEFDPNNSISIEKNLSFDFSLSQNYPNPFNPSTTIEFTLPKPEFVELKVYNILGKEVSTLVSNKLNQGNHTYNFDGTNLASGIYYYQLIAGEYRDVKKMILLK